MGEYFEKDMTVAFMNKVDNKKQSKVISINDI